MPRLIFSAALAAVAFAAACNKEKAPAAGPPAAVPAPSDTLLPPDTVVATMGAEKITSRDLETHLRSQIDQLEERYKKDRFDLRKQGLEQMILEKLVKVEATKRGLTDEQLLKAEIDDKVPPPSDEQIKAVWDQNSSQLPPGSKFEAYKDRIVDQMTQRPKQEAARTFFEKLKKDGQVQIKLSEPRVVVEAKGPARGPANAKITMIEFSDFQCPYCGRAHDTVEEVMHAYAGKIRLIFRNYPLEFHPFAAKAAEAALCADEQGKFWEYYDLLFANQQKLDVPQLKEHAGAVGLDAGKFTACLDSGKQAAVVKSDTAAGAKAGVNGTPAFFINGVFLSGAQPLDEFKRVIDQELAN
jgi:protein-disulfide isomerase